MNGRKGYKKLKKLLSNITRVGLDTNILIYYLNSQSVFYPQVVQLFEIIFKRRINMVTSVITLAELLSFQAPTSMLKKLEEELLLVPNFQMQDVDRNVSKEAAAIRRRYKFRLVDSIQLASAISGKAQVFITNDHRLKSFKKLKIISLSDLA